MDVQMPVMDGYTATRQIRALEDPALAGIPILAMTANAFDEDRRNALASGMNGFLSKPIIVGDLVQELRKILSDARSLPAVLTSPAHLVQYNKGSAAASFQLAAVHSGKGTSSWIRTPNALCSSPLWG